MSKISEEQVGAIPPGENATTAKITPTNGHSPDGHSLDKPSGDGQPEAKKPFNFLLAILPVLLLGAVIFLFARTGAGLDVKPAAPIEKLQIDSNVMDKDGFHIHVRNTGPEAMTISQVVINDALWVHKVQPAAKIGRLQTAVIDIPYPWVRGEAYEINLMSANAVIFPVSVPVAFATPKPKSATFWSFTLIGVYVGVIPIFLGLMWYPALRSLSGNAWVFLLAATAGILIYLGIDATGEAIDLAGTVGESFQGLGLTAIGIVGTFMLLNAISMRQKSISGEGASRRLALATTISIGIGLHNLGEGLAIGAAYALGELALGSFLVIGFILQNITESVGIIAPMVHDKPSIKRLAILGLIAGAPAIVGCWIGGFSYSPVLSLLFLAIGAGAVFQVAWEISRLVKPKLELGSAPYWAFSGVTAGMVMLYVTGLMIK